jgi:hypothetical protein
LCLPRRKLLALLPSVLAGEKPLCVGAAVFEPGLSVDALAYSWRHSSLVAAVIIVYSLDISRLQYTNEYSLWRCVHWRMMGRCIPQADLLLRFLGDQRVCCWRLIGFYREELTLSAQTKRCGYRMARSSCWWLSGIWGKPHL